jgi:hypothetical protein
MLAPRRVALRLGSVFARLDVQVDLPLRQSCRGSYRGRVLASHSIGHVVIPALGTMGFCHHFRRRTIYEPVPSPSIFSVVAAVVCCAGRLIDTAVDRRHCRDVIFAAGPRLFRHERSLTMRWRQAMTGCKCFRLHFEERDGGLIGKVFASAGRRRVDG